MPLVRKSAHPEAPNPDPASALAALQNGTADQRWAAARAVSGMPGGLAALAKALAVEQDRHVREVILTSLAGSHCDEGIESILVFIRSDDAHLRTGAVDALRTTKAAIGPYLARLLSDPDADVRIVGCELSRNLPDHEAARLLCERLDVETEPNVCASAVEVLAEVGGTAALATLQRCAERFRGNPFLAFSIDATAARIRAQSNHQRG